MLSGRPESLLQLPARQLWGFFYAEIMRSMPDAHARLELRKQLDKIARNEPEPGAPKTKSGKREIPEVPGIPVPDWWDGDADPFADQHAME